MRTDNPTRAILMVLLAALLTALFGCDKPTLQESAPEVPPSFYLSLNSPEINIQGFKNTGLMKAEYTWQQTGYCVRWETDTFTLQVFIYADTLPNYAMGEINGHGLGLHLDSSFINICNGGQNTPIHYEIKRDTTTLH